MRGDSFAEYIVMIEILISLKVSIPAVVSGDFSR
jgi:hypothetical protein